MIEKIYVFGTSFAEGGGFEFNINKTISYSYNGLGEEYTKENFSFPGQLRKLLPNIEIVNLSKSGYGNERMYRLASDIVFSDNFDVDNSLLIFDEVMSGFRVSLGGAQEIYNIKPDLTALGKVIGGGLPVGAFGGREEIMNYLAPSGPVYQAGTLSGNPLAMAGGSALLQLLINKNPFQGLEDSASMLLGGMKSIMAESGIPFSVNKIGGMFGFFFLEELPQNINDVSKSDDVLFSNFLNSCIRNGIYFAPSKYEAGFISAMHQDNEINKTLETVKKIIKKGINNEI